MPDSNYIRLLAVDVIQQVEESERASPENVENAQNIEITLVG